jgi:phospholipase/lecithinase/hemolysin
MSRGAQPAFRSSSARPTNCADGAARAREDGRNVNFSTQVQAYLQQSGGVAPSDGLYVIALGGNDVRDALVAFAQGRHGAAVMEAALTSIADNIVTLYGAGARTFIVWNAPDIGRTPALAMAGPIAAQFGTQLAQLYNASLASMLDQISDLPGIEIVAFDAFGLITAIVTNPAAYGMTVRHISLCRAVRAALCLPEPRRVPVLGRDSPNEGDAYHHCARDRGIAAVTRPYRFPG